MFFKKIARSVRSNPTDLGALLICALIGVWIFRNHLWGETNYLGNFDRLNALLNAQYYMLESIREHGLPEAWCDQIFLGVNLFGLPYVSPDPLLLLLAWFPKKYFIWYSGILSCILFIFAGWSAYYFIRDLGLRVLPALVGALLYELSYCSVFIVSNMTAFAILIFLPLILVCLRVGSEKKKISAFVVLTLLLVYLCQFGHLQFTLYAFVEATLYAVLLALTTKSSRPVKICLAAEFIAVVASVPRLVTVANEMALSGRGTPMSFADTYRFVGVYPREWLRWVCGGIFGRYPSEAADLGNSINLSEGMWIYTSTFAALLLVLGVIRSGGKWFGLVRQVNWNVRFHVFAFCIAMAVVLWPGARFLCYSFFLHLNILHPRVIVMALISFVFIVSYLLDQMIPQSPAFDSKQRLLGLCAALAFGYGLFWGGEKLSERAIVPDKIPLELSPWIHITKSFQFMINGSSQPSSLESPENLRAFAADERNVVVEWDPVFGAKDYEVEAVLNNTKVAKLRVGATRIVSSGLDKNAGYRFIVRAASGDLFSEPTAAVSITPIQSSDIKRISDPRRFLTTWISSKELMKIGWSTLGLLFLISLMYFAKNKSLVRWFCRHAIGFAMVFQAASFADFQINGPHVKSTRPFDHDNFYSANGEDYRVPAADTLKQFHDRLEVEKFRSIVVCNPSLVPEASAGYFAMFWKLRITEGYVSGVPERLKCLPWPPGSLAYRTVQFTSASSLPWPLLSLLNVKHALMATGAWHRNALFNSERGLCDVLPSDINIWSNPLTPTPREFFAETVMSVPTANAAVANLFPNGVDTNKIPDVTAVSFAEQWLGGATRFAASGRPDARYRGGVVEVNFSKLDEPRFLVLNELYHPDWRAYIGKNSVPIYPTNAFMRGVVVPKGATKVTFKFEPFFRLKNVFMFSLCGAVLFASFIAYFRRDFRRLGCAVP